MRHCVSGVTVRAAQAAIRSCMTWIFIYALAVAALLLASRSLSAVPRKQRHEHNRDDWHS